MKKCFVFLVFLLFFSKVNAQKPFIPKFDSDVKSWIYLDTGLNTVLELSKLKIDSALFFTEGLAPVRDSKSKLWGFINEEGIFQIKPQFEYVENFIDGFALVMNSCKKDCYQGSEGLLSQNIGSIIDKNGKIILVDNSQDVRVYARFFLTENIGHGFFTFGYAKSVGEFKNFMNSNGEILGETSVNYGKGGIYFDKELDAIKCGLKYFDSKGNVKLDLSRFMFVEGDFSEGYVWTSVEQQISEDSILSIHVLVDLLGTPVVNMDNSEFSSFTPVKNKIATCVSSIDNSKYAFFTETNVFQKIENETAEPNIDNSYIDEVFGDALENGACFIYNNSQELLIIGILLKSGEKLYILTQE